MKTVLIVAAALLAAANLEAAPIDPPAALHVAFAIPDSFQFHGSIDPQRHDTPVFPSRRRAMQEADSNGGVADEVAMLPGTTVWERLGGYRSQGRIRLLVLWESSTGIVSLQTGGHADPYLQWNYAAMSPLEFRRGLLDRFFAGTR